MKKNKKNIINNINSGNLQLSIKIASTTIGLDLVTVKPMSAPIGNLFLTETAEQKAIRKRKERKEKMKEIFTKNEIKNISK